jgi:hypothetical protein
MWSTIDVLAGRALERLRVEFVCLGVTPGFWNRLNTIRRTIVDLDDGSVSRILQRGSIALCEYCTGEQDHTVQFPPDIYGDVEFGPVRDDLELSKFATTAYDLVDMICEFCDYAKVNAAPENPGGMHDIQQMIHGVFSEMADCAVSHANAFNDNRFRTDIPQCELIKLAHESIMRIESINARAADIWPVYQLTTRYGYLD